MGACQSAEASGDCPPRTPALQPREAFAKEVPVQPLCDPAGNTDDEATLALHLDAMADARSSSAGSVTSEPGVFRLGVRDLRVLALAKVHGIDGSVEDLPEAELREWLASDEVQRSNKTVRKWIDATTAAESEEQLLALPAFVANDTPLRALCETPGSCDGDTLLGTPSTSQAAFVVSLGAADPDATWASLTLQASVADTAVSEVDDSVSPSAPEGPPRPLTTDLLRAHARMLRRVETARTRRQLVSSARKPTPQ